ncbi:transposase, partial [Aeromonas rivipollensis]|nr:transposase [Aeromonas rivipollensis]
MQLLIEHSGKSKKYVTGQLNRYFRCGGMPNALLPNYFACGKNHQLPTTYLELEKGKICLASKRGRETLYGKSYRGITQQDIKNIVLFSKKIRSGTEVQLSRLYLDFCMEYASAELRPMGAPDEDIAEPFKMLLSRNYLISPKSFKRQLTKYVDQLTFLKKRVG